jgi:hypothetical protein
LLHVLSYYDIIVNQVSFLLLSLLCQDMTVESVMSLNFTCSGKTKSLFGTGISLYFWHFV